MPRLARLPAVLALLVLLVPGLVFAEEKTFEDKGFKLTASDSWQWMELSSDMTESGYVARLGRRARGSTAMVDVRVVPTNGLPLEDLAQEVKDGLSANLSAVQGTKTTTGKLSGLECSLVLIKGLNKRDSNVLIRAYTLEAGGMFHQMMFTLADGAETKQAREVDALRRGYRLLKGAGPEEEEPEGIGEDGLGGGGGDMDEEGDAPSQEGRTLVFESQNVKWTLPVDSPFEWDSINRDQSIEKGILVRARARMEIETSKEKEDEEKKSNDCVVLLAVGPQDEGWTAKGLMNAQGYHSSVEQNVFDRVDYGRMKIVDELPVGNMTGAALQMVGAKDDKVRVFRAYAVGLKGRRYVFEVILSGNGMVDDVYKQSLKDLIAGVEFIDTFVWARGPLAIPGVPGHDQERGRFADAQKEVTSMGFKAKKPKGMSQLSFESARTGGNLRIAWEKRNEDKTAYLYFDVQTWPQKATRGVKNFDEGKIKEREGQWLEHASSPNTVKKGKTPWFKTSYARGKGLGYEFTGYLDETPYKEIGYLVEYKKYVYWVRYQLGGEGADKIFAKDMKALKKAVKFGT